MKNLILALLTGLFLSAYAQHPERGNFCLMPTEQLKKPVFDMQRMPKRDMIEKAWEYEVEITKDPTTGTVPRERLITAKEYARSLEHSRSGSLNINWMQRGPTNCAGRSRAWLEEGDTQYVGSVSGGLYKKHVNGTKWDEVYNFTNLAVSVIIRQGNIMYIGTGEGWYNGDAVRGNGIWKSTDGGITWTHLSSTDNTTFNYVQDMVITASGTIFAATFNGGVQRSADGGVTWSKVLGVGYSATTNRAADLEVVSNGDILATMGIMSQDGIYRTTDNGNTWSNITGSISGHMRIAVSAYDSVNYTALIQNTSYNGAIYTTSNGGTSWAYKGAPSAYGMANFCRGQAWYNLAVKMVHPDTIYIGGIDILRSVNGGTSWTQLSQWHGANFPEVHADQHNFWYKDNTLWAVNDGGLYSYKSGTFYNHEENLITAQFYSCAVHPGAGSNYFLAGAQDNGSHQFNYEGPNATVEVTGGDGAFVHIDQIDPKTQFTSYVYTNFFRSLDSGQTWQQLQYGYNGPFINPSDYDNNGKSLYAGHGNGSYFLLKNANTSNTSANQVSVSAFSGAQVRAVTVHPDTSHRVYFGLSNGSVVRIDNANDPANFTASVIRTGTGSVSCILVENDSRIIITYSNYGAVSVFETVNGGNTWNSIEGNLPDFPVRWAVFNPQNNDQLLLATELGVWTTDDINGSATNWTIDSDGMGYVRTDMLQVRESDSLIVAATHGKGLLTTKSFMAPHAAFYADKYLTYQGIEIQFTDNSAGAGSWSWDFGDGTFSTNQNPVKAFSIPGKHIVTLTVNGALIASDTVHILPDRSTPYISGFETNINDFGSEAIEGKDIWERGIPGNYLTSVSSPVNAWKTDLDADIPNKNTTCVLMTPNFDVTDVSKNYTLRFSMSMELQYCNAPFAIQLQYSTDSGQSWTRLGVVNDALGTNWYNVGPGAGCNSNVGPGGFSWAFSNQTPQQSTYNINQFSGGTIAFRWIVYLEGGWSTGYSADGVLIDDVEILVSGEVLPVTFLDVRASGFEHFNVVEFTTTGESNIDYFLVQRSDYGNNFYDLPGKIHPKGNVTSINKYHFTDTKNGDCLYRVKQVDMNGNIEFSNIVAVESRVNSCKFTYYNISSQVVVPTVPGVYIVRIDCGNSVYFSKFLKI